MGRGLASPFGYFSEVETMEIAGCAVIFWTCRYGMTNRNHCMALLYFLIALGVGETALGYYLSNHPEWFPFGPTEQAHVRYAPHWIGTYSSPHSYACFLVMTVGVALALGSFSKLAWPVRIVFCYLALMMIIGIIYSGSKEGWVTLLAGIGALVVIGIRNGTLRWWVPVTAALSLIGMSESLFSFSQITQARWGEAHGLLMGGAQADLRVQMTRDALRFAREHLVWGAGAGAFSALHVGKLGNSFAIGSDLPPNDYLNCLDEYGVIGLGIALFFAAAITLKFFRPLVVDNRWQDRVLVAAGFAVWVGLLVYSLLDFNLHIPANALLLFALIGLAMSRIKDEIERHWSTVSLAPLSRWVGWTVILLSLFFAWEVASIGAVPWAEVPTGRY